MLKEYNKILYNIKLKNYKEAIKLIEFFNFNFEDETLNIYYKKISKFIK